MLRVKFDKELATSKGSGGRKGPTEYLRGTVGAIVAPEGTPQELVDKFAPLLSQRVLVWSDTDNVEALQGKTVDITADLRDKISVDGSGQKTTVLANLDVLHELVGEEARAFQITMMAAQQDNLEQRGVRTITRQAPGAPATPPAETAANAALPADATPEAAGVLPVLGDSPI